MFLLVITIASFNRTTSSTSHSSSSAAKTCTGSTGSCIGMSVDGGGSIGMSGSTGMSTGSGGGEVTVWEVLIVVFCVTSSLYG